MNTPLVSVIVPVYKAEAYLHKCVDSLLAQTMTDFEVLLIDDGSPDRSGAICDEYAAKDSRIRVFHKENGGVASARQVGIENVRGEYTIHADPDDWVEPTMLEELYAKAKEDDADMVICDYYEERVDSQKYIKQNLTDDLSSKTLLGLLLGQKLHGSLWNKLIKIDKIKEYKLFLPNFEKLGS
jgi:glycosyltransferase involved in cell wall biosynthesis